MPYIDRRTVSSMLVGLWGALGLPLAASTRRSLALARLTSLPPRRDEAPSGVASFVGQEGGDCGWGDSGDGGDGGDNCNYYYGDGGNCNETM